MACDAAWHLECLREGREDVCPTCKRSLSAQEEEAAQAEAAAVQRGAARGRRTFFAGMWLFVSAAVTGIAGNFVLAQGCIALPHVLFIALPVLVLAASRQTHLALPGPISVLVKVHDHGDKPHRNNEYARLGIALGSFLGVVVSAMCAWGLRDHFELLTVNASAAVLYALAALLARSSSAHQHAHATDGA